MHHQTNLKSRHIADDAVSGRRRRRWWCTRYTSMVWVKRSGWPLHIWHNWRRSLLPLCELLWILQHGVGNGLVAADRDWQSEGEAPLLTRFGSLIAWQRVRATNRPTGETERLGVGVLGNGSAVAADLTTGDSELRITEDVCLRNMLANCRES